MNISDKLSTCPCLLCIGIWCGRPQKENIFLEGKNKKMISGLWNLEMHWIWAKNKKDKFKAKRSFWKIRNFYSRLWSMISKTSKTRLKRRVLSLKTWSTEYDQFWLLFKLLISFFSSRRTSTESSWTYVRPQSMKPSLLWGKWSRDKNDTYIFIYLYQNIIFVINNHRHRCLNPPIALFPLAWLYL